MGLTRLKDYAVLTESLTKKFRNITAVDDIHLNIRYGEIFGLIGSDGAGKTTIIQMLCGILAPSSGLMFVDGHDVEKEPDAIRSRLGYMSQDFTLYPDMTVEENIDFIADLRNVPKEARERQKERLLRFSRMGPFRNRRASALSGGMKKKLALSCALIHRPKVLILDEPTTAVDPLSRSELWKILYEFIVEGVTIIISTPYMDEAERCNRVALIQDGAVMACDVPTRLKKMIRQKVCSIKPDKLNQASSALREDLLVPGQVYGDRIRMFFNNPGSELPKIQRGLEERGISVTDCSVVEPTMDDVFMNLLKGGDTSEKKNITIPFFGPDQSNIPVMVSGLTKTFGHFTAVDHVSFEVGAGTVFGLLGANGAGKTTIIKMLCGLLTPSSGKAIVAGHNTLTHSRRVRNNIGYMAQLFSLYPDLTVSQNLDFYASVYGLVNKEKKTKMDWALELAGLKGMEKFLTRELSGGWKQKLALGCAIMHQPTVLFLDEPTSGVDPVGRAEFWDAVQRFSEAGVTTIVTTHFMDEAERCNMLGLMNMGSLVALGTPTELKKNVSADFYEVSATPILESYEKLLSIDFITQASLFGNKIHIMTERTEKKLTKESLWNADVRIDEITRITPSLEDVFIYNIIGDGTQDEAS